MADSFTMNDNVDEFPTSPQPQQPPNIPSPQSLSPQQRTQQSIFGAVESHFIAQRNRSIANLNAYLNSSVGVAEHPDVVEEVIKLLNSIDNAEGMISTLKRITNPS